MSLFSTDITPAPNAAQSNILHAQHENLIRTLGGSLKELEELMLMLTPNTSVHYHTGGKWHRYQLITKALAYTGPAAVYLSTWSMSEPVVRSLLMLKESGLITELYLVISERINERSPAVMQLAINAFDKIVFDKRHAKISVLIGEKGSLVEVGSANLTRNPKEEAGMMSTHQQVIDFRLKRLQDVLDKR